MHRVEPFLHKWTWYLPSSFQRREGDDSMIYKRNNGKGFVLMILTLPLPRHGSGLSLGVGPKLEV